MALSERQTGFTSSVIKWLRETFAPQRHQHMLGHIKDYTPGVDGMVVHGAGAPWHSEQLATNAALTSHTGAASPHSGHEVTSNKDTSTSLGTSDTKYPSQNAVKEYVDTAVAGVGGGTGSGILTDTQANRPAAADNDGALFVPTDGYYPAISNGSTWDVYAIPGVKCTNPPAYNSFSEISFGSTTTLVTDGDGLLMTMNGQGASQTDVLAVSAIPGSGAYDLIVGMEILFMFPTNYTGVGICITDGNGATPKSIKFSLVTGPFSGAYNNATSLYADVTKMTNPATYNSTYLSGSAAPPFTSGKLFMKLHDDRSSYLTWSVSTDCRSWSTIWSGARTDWLTPAYAGIELTQSVTQTASTLTRAKVKIFHWFLG